MVAWLGFLGSREWEQVMVIRSCNSLRIRIFYFPLHISLVTVNLFIVFMPCILRRNKRIQLNLTFRIVCPWVTFVSSASFDVLMSFFFLCWNPGLWWHFEMKMNIMSSSSWINWNTGRMKPCHTWYALDQFSVEIQNIFFLNYYLRKITVRAKKIHSSCEGG